MLHNNFMGLSPLFRLDVIPSCFAISAKVSNLSKYVQSFIPINKYNSNYFFKFI